MTTILRKQLTLRRLYTPLICSKCIRNSNINSSIRRFHIRKPLQASSPQQGPLGFKDQALRWAVYGTFAAGGVVLSAVIFRELKDFYRKRNGIVFQEIREWGRLRPYSYHGYILPERIVSVMNDIEKFETSQDDVWIVSFPRSGGTWLQEIVYLINSNLDMESACTLRQDERCPHLEFPKPGVSAVQNKPVPRLIKSHLPYSLLPTSVKELKPKVIYLARDPKDVVVSYFFYTRLMHPLTRYTGDFPEFFKLFLEDKVMYGPWSDHVLEFWDRRQEENILYLTYEDLKKDTDGCIDKIAAFLGKSVTADQKRQIIEYCSFTSMKANPQTNHSWLSKEGLAKEGEGDFLRKGCIGDWMNHFNDTMNGRMNAVLLTKFVNSDINFSFSSTPSQVDDESNDGQ